MRIHRILHFEILASIFFCGALFSQAGAFRLPEDLAPVHYELWMSPILDEIPGYTRFTSPGIVDILVNCTQSTNRVILHAKNIEINQSEVKVTDQSSGKQLPVVSIDTIPSIDFLIINLDESLEQSSDYLVHLEFISTISQTELSGMYLEFYTDHITNETRYVATTMFAPNAARKAFPCFDEPSFKATYGIHLAHHEKYHAVSNTPIESSEAHEQIPDWIWDSFEKSVPTSTYLVCMIVSDLASEDAPPEITDVDVKVFAPLSLIERDGGKYSSNLTAQVMVKFQDHFDHPYSYSKLFSFALPQFYFTAMENWGLITYTRTALIYLEGETTEEERYAITLVVSHEVAHQWFGNLVTCKWWTWIWLNEGFATFLGHLGTEMTYPEFKPWDQFIVNVIQTAMEFDLGPSTHPIENPPQGPEKVGLIYNDISYEKAASIIRMIEDLIGKNAMVSAWRTYIQAHKLGLAEQDDIYFHIQQAVDDEGTVVLPTTIGEVMDTWTMQEGFPLLEVSRINSEQIQISQKRFGNDSTTNGWWIPIRISVSNGSEKLVLMRPTAQSVTVDIPDEQEFILDPESMGYFRIQYEDRLLNNLLKNPEIVTESAKASLINNYYNFAVFGMTSFDTAIKSLSLLGENIESIAWRSAVKVVDKYIYKYAPKESVEKLRESELVGLMDKILSRSLKLRWTGAEAIVLEEILELSCFLDSKACKEFAAQYLSSIRDTNGLSSMQPDFREPLLCKVLESENNIEAVQLVEKALEDASIKAVSGEERKLVLLPCSKSQESLKKGLKKLLNEYLHSNFISISEDKRVNIFKNVIRSENRRQVLIELIQSKLEAEEILSDTASSRIVALLNYLASFPSDEMEIRQIESLSSKNGVKVERSVVDDASDILRTRKVHGSSVIDSIMSLKFSEFLT